jgi:hypothetical protein
VGHAERGFAPATCGGRLLEPEKRPSLTPKNLDDDFRNARESLIVWRFRCLEAIDQSSASHREAGIYMFRDLRYKRRKGLQ